MKNLAIPLGRAALNNQVTFCLLSIFIDLMAVTQSEGSLRTQN
jgi:hypothetical protein